MCVLLAHKFKMYSMKLISDNTTLNETKNSFNTKPQFFQPKLTINQPNDVYEQEADAMADKVMRMSDSPVNNNAFFKPSISSLQRKCSHCKEEEKKVQRKKGSHKSTTASSQTEGYINTLSGGKALGKDERSFFEPRMNYDFSNVRLHTDHIAAKSAQSINALAYTVRNNIVFNSGQYSPGSDSGKKLLGHELTHVIQQQNTTLQPAIQRFEGHEHQYFGDQGLQDLHAYLIEGEGRAWASEFGYDVDQLIASIEQDRFFKGDRIDLDNTSITPGEAISLSGDLYSSWQNLQSAPAAQLRGTTNPDDSPRSDGILDIMDREANHTISSAGATISYTNLTSGNYLDLAQKNTTHFSPANRKEWQRLHTIAKQTVRDHPGNAAKMNEALLIDAAAGHFLTDAFAAGHLINREDTLAQIHLYLLAHPLQTTNPEMQTFVAVAASQGAIDQLVLKAIHDHFNSYGVDVNNKKGMHWRTYGDNSLHNAPQTQHIGSLAVFLSRLQVINAAADGQQNGDDEILDLLPVIDSLFTNSHSPSEFSL